MEKEVEFTNIKLKHIQEESKVLGHGFEGICYLLNSKEVLKLFYDNGHTKNNILQFSNIDVPNFSFPKKIVYNNGKIVGYITTYIKGKRLSNQINLMKINYDEVINATKEACDNIKELSKYRILSKDMNDSNILYYNKTFKFIDTMCYKKSRWTKEQTYKQNIIDFAITLYISLIYNNENISLFAQKNKYLQNYFSDINIVTNPIETLKILRNELSEFCKCDIKELSQAENKLKKMVF